MGRKIKDGGLELWDLEVKRLEFQMANGNWLLRSTGANQFSEPRLSGHSHNDSDPKEYKGRIFYDTNASDDFVH